MLNPLNILSKFIKSGNQRELDKLQNIVNEVNKLEENISKLLPKVKTTTSKVYDYALGNSKEIPLKHLCLPIWFGLEESISDQVISELKNSK